MGILDSLSRLFGDKANNNDVKVNANPQASASGGNATLSQNFFILPPEALNNLAKELRTGNAGGHEVGEFLQKMDDAQKPINEKLNNPEITKAEKESLLINSENIVGNRITIKEAYIEGLRSKMQVLTKERDDLASERDRLARERDELHKEKQNRRHTISEQANLIAHKDKTIEELKQTIEKLEYDIDPPQKNSKEKREELKDKEKELAEARKALVAKSVVGGRKVDIDNFLFLFNNNVLKKYLENKIKGQKEKMTTRRAKKDNVKEILNHFFSKPGNEFTITDLLQHLDPKDLRKVAGECSIPLSKIKIFTSKVSADDIKTVVDHLAGISKEGSKEAIMALAAK
ncbi:MAG: hypothetical protein NUW37_02215 [Planctomycetes bacterium]|nr:hypothetical protein [Planctomycetota bacterium]